MFNSSLCEISIGWGFVEHHFVSIEPDVLENKGAPGNKTITITIVVVRYNFFEPTLIINLGEPLFSRP